MTADAQLQSRKGTQGRRKVRLPVDMPSKHRPTWDPESLRARMVAARKKLGLNRKEAGAKAGMGDWSWYKKEPVGGVEFSLEECVRFAAAVGAPTLFPFYDWDHAADLDARLGWDK
jgi:hypothetical protein